MMRFKTLTWGLGLALLVSLPLVVSARSEQRPISDFLDAQPLDRWAGWLDPATNGYLNFDAFGKVAEAWGLSLPTFDGSVTMRDLADGSVHVSVLLLTRNAMCFGFQLDETPNIAFGYTVAEVRLGATPSLGDGLFRAEFTMPSADSPLPTRGQLISGAAGYPLLRVSHVVNCSGVLRSASGYPDGTPGAARTTQLDVAMIGGPAGCPAGDCWPAERVDFWPTGPR